MDATTQPAPAGQELRYTVDGMHCANCERAINGEVSRVAGVQDVDVDLLDSLVTVRGEELVEQVVRDAILQAGYTAYLR